MEYFVNSNDEIIRMFEEGKHSCTVLDAKNGCVSGCKAGYTFCRDTEYGNGGVHEDQEGFLVLEGNGYAKFGDTEFRLYPGIAMIAPAGVRHVFKKNEDSGDLKIFWFHSSI